MRYGAVLLEDASGNVLATAYLSGTGTGAQVLFPPGTQTMLTPDLYTYWPEGLAVDSQSNLFFVDGNSNNYAGAVHRVALAGKLLRGCAITHQPLSSRCVPTMHPEPWLRTGQAISMSG